MIVIYIILIRSWLRCNQIDTHNPFSIWLTTSYFYPSGIVLFVGGTQTLCIYLYFYLFRLMCKVSADKCKGCTCSILHHSNDVKHPENYLFDHFITVFIVITQSHVFLCDVSVIVTHSNLVLRVNMHTITAMWHDTCIITPHSRKLDHFFGDRPPIPLYDIQHYVYNVLSIHPYVYLSLLW